MTARAHCDSLTRLLFTLEANVHARLGYFPPEFRETCREHITAHLRALELHLNAELVAVQHSLRELGVQQHSGTHTTDIPVQKTEETYSV